MNRDNMELEVSHQTFLRSLLSKGMLNVSEVKQLYVSIMQDLHERDCKDTWTQEIGQFVVDINGVINHIGQDIVKGYDEESGQNFYALINTRESDVSALATNFTPSQLDFFMKMLAVMIEGGEGSLGSIRATNLRLNPAVKDIIKTEREIFLQSLEEKRLIKLKDGQITLSGRSILELEPFIKDQFPDSLTLCRMCQKLCVQSQTCRHCDSRFHLICVRRYMKKAGKLQCPNTDCRQLWEQDISHIIPSGTQATQQDMATQQDTANSIPMQVE